jgi:hypothetical protein
LIKEASAAKPQAGPLVEIRVAASRIVPLVDKEGKVDAKQIKDKAFGDTGKDKMTATVEGGEALKIRVAIDSATVKFFGLIEKEKKEKE